MPSDKEEVPRRHPWYFRPAIFLPLLAVLITAARLHTYNEPTDRDQAAYAVIAHEVLSGKRLYAGFLLDQKPPAIHATYGIAELIAGYGRGEIYLLGVGAALAMLGAAWFAGKNLGQWAGIWAALFWTVICSHLPLEANQPNSEVFINAWTLFGLGFLLQPRGNRWNWRKAVGAGCCFAAASLYKHSVVVIPFFVSLAYVLLPSPGRTRRESVLDIVIVGSIGVLAWGLLFAYFGATGRFQSVINCLFVYNRYYAGNLQGNLFDFSQLFPAVLDGMMPLFVLSLLGLFLALRQRNYSQAAFLAALAAATEVAVALPGRFYPHYYQLWFSFLILASAYGVDLILQRKDLPSGFRRAVGPSVLAVLLAIEIPSFFLPAREWSRLKYGDIFLVTTDLAKEINGRLLPGETFFQLGSQTQLYFDTGRRPIGALADYGVFSGPLAPMVSSMLMRELTAAPPDLLVVEKFTLPQIPPGHPLLPWISRHYDQAPVSFDHDPLYLFVRKNSPLELRLKAEAGRKSSS